MVQWLSKRIIVFAATLCSASLLAQIGPTVNHEDYKDPNTHEKFKKRRISVAAWQIHELKKGAIVVRLKSNQTLIDGLRKDGKNEEADKKEAEQYLINREIVRAWKDKYKFSKVYFLPSAYSDSLRNGAQKGIFYDSTLALNQNFEMTEPFYLIAERGYVYNSSIGFVPEDSALSTVEAGNPTREMAIVIKNKYGHQLKAPFPYYVQDKTFSTALTPVPIKVNYKGKEYAISIPKAYTYHKYAPYVEQLDEKLSRFYRKSPAPEETDQFEESKPFFY